MRVFIAASWCRKQEAKSLAQVLQRRGHIITARWLSEPLNEASGMDYFADAPSMVKFARQDETDVRLAGGLVLLTGDDALSLSRGGKNVEFGLALAMGKRIFILGPKENVYSWHPAVRVCATVEGLLEAMR